MGEFNDELQPWMSRAGFEGTFLARQNGEVVGPPEGVALFVRSAVFETLQCGTATFSHSALLQQLLPGVCGGEPVDAKSTGLLVLAIVGYTLGFRGF